MSYIRNQNETEDESVPQKGDKFNTYNSWLDLAKAVAFFGIGWHWMKYGSEDDSLDTKVCFTTAIGMVTDFAMESLHIKGTQNKIGAFL